MRRFLRMIPKNLYNLQFTTPVETKRPDVKLTAFLSARVANCINPIYELNVKGDVNGWINEHNMFVKNNALFLRFFIYPNFPIEVGAFRFSGQDGPEQTATLVGVANLMTPAELKFFQKVTTSLANPIKSLHFDVNLDSISRFVQILE